MAKKGAKPVSDKRTQTAKKATKSRSRKGARKKKAPKKVSKKKAVNKRSQAAKKGWETRKKKQRSLAAKKGWETRKKKQRSLAAKKGWETRKKKESSAGREAALRGWITRRKKAERKKKIDLVFDRSQVAEDRKAFEELQRQEGEAQLNRAQAMALLQLAELQRQKLEKKYREKERKLDQAIETIKDLRSERNFYFKRLRKISAADIKSEHAEYLQTFRGTKGYGLSMAVTRIYLENMDIYEDINEVFELY